MLTKPILAALLAGSTLALASCQKTFSTPADTLGTAQTVNASLTKNSTYTYALPSGGATYKIITPSATGADVDVNASAAALTYTPAPDFVGADVVEIVSTSRAASGSGCGGSQGGATQSDTLTFRLQVTDPAVGS